MNLPRSQATVTEIGDGRILVAGGWVQKNGSDSWTATDTAEIYDRNTGTWTMTGSMTTPRALAAATQMANGRVLVTGGDSAWASTEGQTVLGTAEAYDPAGGTWSSAGVMSSPRAAHVAISLPDGMVLAAGGWADGRELGLPSADEYDPATDAWHRINDMPGAHAQGRGLSLSDGRVMILGGFDAGSVATATVEVFNPAGSTWIRLAGLQQAVYWPCAVALDNDRVLVAGGWTDKAPTHAIEVFDPSGP
jgi:N-acetylneuraminic acid mutarotase